MCGMRYGWEEMTTGDNNVVYKSKVVLWLNGLGTNHRAVPWPGNRS